MAARIVVDDRHAVASLGQRHSRTEPHDTADDDIDAHNDPLLQCDIVYRTRYSGSRAGFHMTIGWKGVFPAVTTQLREDLSIDLADTQRVVDDLISDGVTGVIALGPVGGNKSLEDAQKNTVLAAIVEVVAGG